MAITLPSLSWVDGVGSAVIQSPTLRVGDWEPDVIIIGDDATPLGTGIPANWVHRLDYVVAFEMQELPVTLTPLFQRLKLWLSGGGPVTLITGDLNSATYICTMWEKKPPTWALDRTNYCYVLKVYLRNGQQQPLTVDYQPADPPAAGSPSIVVTPNPIQLTTS